MGLDKCIMTCGSSQGALIIKKLPAKKEDIRFDPWVGKTPPGGGHGNPLQYSCLWRIPWTQEPDGLQSIGLQRVGRLPC